MCAQEAEIEKSRARVDTRDHKEGESEGYFSGGVYCRGCLTKTDCDVQVCVQIAQNRFLLVNNVRMNQRQSYILGTGIDL